MVDRWCGRVARGWQTKTVSAPPQLRLGLALWLILAGASMAAESTVRPLLIPSFGDSITRGSCLARHADGPFKGEPIGLPHPEGGCWRKPLQDQLRAAGRPCDFVGELRHHSLGMNGQVDAAIVPDHHGQAGFSNRLLLSGGMVPTCSDQLVRAVNANSPPPGSPP